MSSNDDGVSVKEYGGGVIRVQTGVAGEDEAATSAHPSRHYSGSMALDPITGAAHQRDLQRINTADVSKPGILATARTSFGSPARELTPDCVVEYGGMTMRLSEAEAAGLVSRNEAGRYIEATAGATQAAQQTQQQPPPQAAEAGDVNGMKPELFSPELEAGLTKLAEGVAPQAINRVLVDAVLMAAETGSLAQLNLEAVVSKTGMSPDKAAQFMEASITALSGQVDRVLAELQVDPGQFVEWSRRERPEQFKQAMLEQVGVRSLSGYRALAKDFLKSTTPSAEGLKAAGYDTMLDPTSKRLLVRYQGTWMDAHAAAVQGLI